MYTSVFRLLYKSSLFLVGSLEAAGMSRMFPGNGRTSPSLEILAFFLLLRPACVMCFSSLRLRGFGLEPKRAKVGYTLKDLMNQN